MNCERAQADLLDYLSGQLSAAGQAALTAHLAGCADCRRELPATQRLWLTLGQVPSPEPSPRLRPAFYAMLAAYKTTLADVPAPEAPPASSLAGLRRWWRARLPELQLRFPTRRLAYRLGLLGLGALGGYWLSAASTQRPLAPAAAADHQQVAALAAQVRDMRQVLLLALIENSSATERLRAVGYTKELSGPNERVVTALLSTLNHDPNVNVRLATLEALAPLAPADPAVRLGLVRALAQQRSPLVQAALADVMVQLQERRSVPPLRQLLRRPDLNELVKSKIEHSIQALSSGPPAAPSASPSSSPVPSSSIPTPARHDQTPYFSRPAGPARAALAA